VRVTLVMATLGGGGAERAAANMANPEVAERLGAEKIMSMWEELVVECASHG
jgi:hypothetical protein